MPNQFEPYNPASLSGIRKRLIENQTRRVALLEKSLDLNALQLQRASLSSSELDNLVVQRQLLKDFASKSRDMLGLVEQQNVASTRAEANLKLRPSRLRMGEPLRRSIEDRNFAILGLLQRERRQNAPLTRAALARAQAVAASRKRYDLRRAYRLSGKPSSQDASFQGEASFYDLRGVDVSRSDVDPCVEFTAAQRRRREVMFAEGIASIGYRSRHFRKVC